MSIIQHDLDHQRGANARTLAHLLQSENNTYVLISNTNGERRSTPELLRMVVYQDLETRVFLDVGAQVYGKPDAHAHFGDPECFFCGRFFLLWLYGPWGHGTPLRCIRRSKKGTGLRKVYHSVFRVRWVQE